MRSKRSDPNRQTKGRFHNWDRASSSTQTLQDSSNNAGLVLLWRRSFGPCLILKVALAAENIRGITSHGARHAAGSTYAVMRAEQQVIGALLGHSDSASTTGAHSLARAAMDPC